MTTEKIFISYSSKDLSFTTNLKDDWTKAGFDVWLDQINLSSGDRWDNEIEKALKGATIVLLVLSPGSVRSEEFKNEVHYAQISNKRIIPLLLRVAIFL